MAPAPFLVISALLLLACSGTNRTVQQDARFGGTDPNDSLFFSFERTPCFGQCPAFRVNIFRDGTASYEGASNVERIGRYTGRFGMADLEALLKEAEGIDFFAMDDSYDGPVTDLPAMHLHLVSGARNKRIMARYKVPPALKEFGKYVDEMVRKASWNRVSNE